VELPLPDLGALAGVDLASGAPDSAAAHAELALAAYRYTGDRLGTARALALLGHAAWRTGDVAAAAAHRPAALSMYAATAR
jgi:hypothetical protein